MDDNDFFLQFQLQCARALTMILSHCNTIVITQELSILSQREDNSEFLTKFTLCVICVDQSSLVYCSALPAAIQAIHLTIMTHTQHCYELAAINATIKHTQVPNPRTAYVIIINCTFPYEVFHNKIPGTLLKSVETV